MVGRASGYLGHAFSGHVGLGSPWAVVGRASFSRRVVGLWPLSGRPSCRLDLCACGLQGWQWLCYRWPCAAHSRGYLPRSRGSSHVSPSLSAWCVCQPRYLGSGLFSLVFPEVFMATCLEWRCHFLRSVSGRLPSIVIVPVFALTRWRALRRAVAVWRRDYPGWSWVGFYEVGLT